MIRILRLHEAHEALGAEFGRLADAETVLGYGATETELRALRETVGVADRSHRGLLRVAGPEAALFLHGLVTNEVKALKVGEGNASTVIHAKGKMLGDCRVLRIGEEELWLDVDPEARGRILAHLEGLLISEDCEIQDVTGSAVLLGVWGPYAPRTIERLLGSAPPVLAENHHRLVSVDGSGAYLLGSRAYGAPGNELWVAPEDAPVIWERLVSAAREAGGAPVGDRALDALRIHHSVPRWGADMDEDTIPLEANLAGSISYTKGCYVGQEVIAKATYRGRVRRKLARFEGQGAGFRPGAQLYDGEVPVGRLTSVLDPDPAGGPALALGYVRLDRLETGRQLSVEGGGAVRITWAPEEN